MNIAHQTPSSNLCNRSMTNNLWKSAPCGPRSWENAFFDWMSLRWSCWLQTYLGHCQRMYPDNCWDNLWVDRCAPHVILHWACSMSHLQRPSSTRTDCLQHLMSTLVPSWEIWFFSTRQHGHGCFPKNLIQERRTLKIELISVVMGIVSHELFRVVGGIREYTRKDASCNSILKLKWNSIDIGVHKTVIKNDLPYWLNEFAQRWVSISLVAALPNVCRYLSWTELSSLLWCIRRDKTVHE